MSVEDGACASTSLGAVVAISAESDCRHSSDSVDSVRRKPIFNLCYIFSRTQEEDSAISFSQELGLLPKSSVCPNCSVPLLKLKCSSSKGYSSYYFECCRSDCKKAGKRRVSLKSGTWFEKAKISVSKSLMLTYCFVGKFTSGQAAVESSTDGVYTSSETVADYYSYCREVCTEKLYSGESFNKIGGPNFTVEIDEAKFGKRKYNRGRVVEGQWVLGGICRETNESFFVPVKDRTEQTLVDLIVRHVAPGTVVHTDRFASYHKLSEHGFTHLSVNHSENFVDPQSGACTNKIESTWWAIRRSLPSNSARKKDFALHLAEYIYRRRYSSLSTSDLFQQFTKDIATIYSGSE